MILVDTSAWVRFLKGLPEARFVAEKVRGNSVLLHPLVFGELLLGGLSAENESLLEALPAAQLPSPEKIYGSIKEKSLPGKGVGWVDASILHVAEEEHAALATFDEALRSCAADLGIPCLPSS